MNSTSAVCGAIEDRRTVRRRARVIASAAVAATAVLVSSCAAGQRAQTADEKPTLDGASVDIGHIALRGLALEAPSSNFYARGSSGQLHVVIVNRGSRTDTLTKISGGVISGWNSYGSRDAAAQVQASGPGADPGSLPASSQSVTVQPGLRVSFGTPDANMSLLLTKFTKRVYPGNVIRLTFTFAKAGSKTLWVPIALSDNSASSVLPGPSASGEGG